MTRRLPVAGPLLLALLVIPFLAPPVRAQGCCTPGTGPLGGLRAGGLSPGAFRLGFHWDRFDLGTTLRGDEEVAPLAERDAHYARLITQLEAGLPGRARVAVELPWEFRSRRVVFNVGGPDPPPVLDFDNSALGDLTTTLLVEVAPRSTRPRPWAIDIGAGLKWATGSIDRTDDGLALPPELQSGTGSTDPLVVAAARRHWTRLGIVGTALYRFTQENDIGYRFGAEFDASLAGWIQAGSVLTLGLDARWRSAERDAFLDIDRPNSGGRRLLVGPRLAGALPGVGVSLEGAYLVPAYQDLFGTQLGVDSEWTLGVSVLAN